MFLWIVSNVPTWFVYLLLFGGIAAGIIGFVGGKLPGIGQYALFCKYGGIASVCLGLWLAGAIFASSEWFAEAEKAKQAAAQIKVESEATNNQLQATIEEQQKKLKEKQRVRTQYVTNTVTKYDNRCDVSNAAVRVLSSAAENGVPPSPSDTDGDSSEVKLSDIIQNTTDNYATCHQIRDKLIGWQTWYKEQKEIYEKSR